MGGTAVMAHQVAGSGIVQMQDSFQHAWALATGLLITAAILAFLRARPSLSFHACLDGPRHCLLPENRTRHSQRHRSSAPAPRAIRRASLRTTYRHGYARIFALTQGADRLGRFMAQIDAPRHSGLPRAALVIWHALPGDNRAVPPSAPDERWTMTRIEQQSYGALNPFSPAQEGRRFAAGVRMLASVLGIPALVDDAPWVSFSIAVERLPHVACARMRAVLDETRQGPLLVALALGAGSDIARVCDQIRREPCCISMSMIGLKNSIFPTPYGRIGLEPAGRDLSPKSTFHD